MLPLIHQLADFLSAITYRTCIHCNAAISQLHSATAADVTAWHVVTEDSQTCVSSASNSGKCYHSCCADCHGRFPRHTRSSGWMPSRPTCTL